MRRGFSFVLTTNPVPSVREREGSGSRDVKGRSSKYDRKQCGQALVNQKELQIYTNFIDLQYSYRSDMVNVGGNASKIIDIVQNG